MNSREKVRTEEVFPGGQGLAANPFESANFLSKLFFTWMTPVISLGTKRIIQEDDIPAAPVANSSECTTSSLSEFWEREKQRNPMAPSLLRAIYVAQWKRMFFTLFNFSIYLCVTFVQPYLVSRILEYVSSGSVSVFGLRSHLAAALFLGLSATIGALAFNQGFYHMQQFGLTTRTALIGMLFEKGIHVSNATRSKYTTGEIMTLMSVDVERIWLGTLLSNWMVMSPPMLVAAVILLWFQVGFASLIVAGALLVWGYFQEKVSGWIGRTRRKFVKQTAERAKLMNEILQGIRVIKLYAWEEASAERINIVRAQEMQHLREYLKIRMINTMMQFLGPVVVAYILFISYSALGGEFDINKVYTCMAILNITRLPIALFPMARSAFQEAVMSLERISSYLVTPNMKTLQLESLVDGKYGDFPDKSSKTVASNFESGVELRQVVPDSVKGTSPPSDILVKLSHCDFTWGDKDKEFNAAIDISTGSGNDGLSPVQQSEPLIEASPEIKARTLSNESMTGIQVELEEDNAPTARERTASSDYQAFEDLPEDDASEITSLDVAANTHEETGDKVAKVFSVENGEPCLRDVSCTINRAEKVAVVGSVGSGKTSLVLAILGQMNRSKGEQSLNAKVSYASQEHWIQNLTVRDNILFDAALVEDNYEVAMDASQLSKDLLTLNDGDLTEIGERGINLSGGQKARVNIARALYAEGTDLYIFDDPLASVDVHVGKSLFEDVVLNRLAESSIVMVFSSNYHFLPFFDKILVVEKGGYVEVCTSYENLKQRFPQYSSVDAENSLKKVRSENDTLALQSVEQAADPQVPSDSLLSTASTRNVTNGTNNKLNGYGQHPDLKALGGLTRGNSIYRSIRQQLLDRSISVKSGMTMTTEDREQGEVSALTYKNYFQASLRDGYWGNGWIVIGTIIISFVIGQVFRIMCDVWVGTWGEDDPDRPDSFYVIIYSCLLFGVICSVVIRSKYFITKCLEASRALHNGLLLNVLRAPVNTYFDITPIGRILNRFSKDLDQVDSHLPDFFLNMLQNSFHVLAIAVMCIASTPYFVVVMVPLSALYYFIQDQFRKTSRELKRLEGVTRSPLYTLFGELLVGLSTVRAFGRQDSFMAKFHSASNRNNRMFFCFWSCSRWLALRLDLVGVVVVVSVALIAVLMRQFDAPVNSNLLGVALVFSLQLAGLLQWTVRTVIETENNMTSVERLLAFNSIDKEDNSEDPKDFFEASQCENWPSKGSLIMNNVGLRYRPELPMVLNGISLTIPGGAKVGVCGRTGAGKSSLMLALFRVVEPEAGSEISVDGVDILQLSLKTLRSRLTIIPQDPVMFSGTLRYNLDPFDKYNDTEIWEALERVHLKDDVLEKFPMKLDHEISERGENISVGQRQLLCIARALLRKSKLIILDEATASVDSFTDQKIQQTIRSAFLECTVLTIAHRLETVADYDMIMVMDKGKVAELAMPYELLQNADGKFRSLVDELGDDMRNSFVQASKKRYEESKHIYAVESCDK